MCTIKIEIVCTIINEKMTEFEKLVGYFFVKESKLGTTTYVCLILKMGAKLYLFFLQ